jgi:hypothetical protein
MRSTQIVSLDADSQRRERENFAEQTPNERLQLVGEPIDLEIQ